jgi:hypothetical protein
METFMDGVVMKIVEVAVNIGENVNVIVMRRSK